MLSSSWLSKHSLVVGKAIWGQGLAVTNGWCAITSLISRHRPQAPLPAVHRPSCMRSFPGGRELHLRYEHVEPQHGRLLARGGLEPLLRGLHAEARPEGPARAHNQRRACQFLVCPRLCHPFPCFALDGAPQLLSQATPTDTTTPTQHANTNYTAMHAMALALAAAVPAFEAKIHSHEKKNPPDACTTGLSSLPLLIALSPSTQPPQPPTPLHRSVLIPFGLHYPSGPLPQCPRAPGCDLLHHRTKPVI